MSDLISMLAWVALPVAFGCVPLAAVFLADVLHSRHMRALLRESDRDLAEQKEKP